jgi:peroxiredoxin
MPAYFDDGTVRLSMRINGQRRTEASALRLSFQRPGKVKLCTGQMRLISNGTNLIGCVDFTRRYAMGDPLKTVTPGSILETPIGAAFLGGTPGVPLLILLGLLTEKDPVGFVLKNSSGLDYRERDGKPILVVRQKVGPDATLAINPLNRLLDSIRLSLRPDEYFGKIPPGLTISEMELLWTPQPKKVSTEPPGPDVFDFQPGDFKLVKTFAEVFSAERGSASLVGQVAPDFKLETTSGRPVSRADFAGKVAILVFWATWSPACADELRALLPIVRRYHGKGVRLLAVNIDDRSGDAEQVRNWLNQQKLDLDGGAATIALDPPNSVGMAYQVQYIPGTVVIDRQGKIRNHYIGYVNDFEKHLARDLEALVNDPPSSPPSPPR